MRADEPAPLSAGTFFDTVWPATGLPAGIHGWTTTRSQGSFGLGGHEPVEFVVEPGRPWKGRIVGRLNRSDQRFHVSLMPQGSAGGLQATIRHRNVVRSLVSPTEVLPQG